MILLFILIYIYTVLVLSIYKVSHIWNILLIGIVLVFGIYAIYRFRDFYKCNRHTISMI